MREYQFTELQQDIGHGLYTLIRISNLGKHERVEMYEKLGQVMNLQGTFSGIASWELVVLRSRLPEIEIEVYEIFPGCDFDSYYEPTEPSEEDVERFVTSTKTL